MEIFPPTPLKRRYPLPSGHLPQGKTPSVLWTSPSREDTLCPLDISLKGRHPLSFGHLPQGKTPSVLWTSPSREDTLCPLDISLKGEWGVSPGVDRGRCGLRG